MNRTEHCAVKKLIGLLLQGLAVLAMFHAAEAAAQSYLGTYCWNMTITFTTVTGAQHGPFVMQADVAHVGGNTYSMHGRLTPSGDAPAIYSGSGPIIGNTLYLSMAGSQSHTSEAWRDTSVAHLELDLSTLNGTIYDVGTDYNPATGVFSNHRYTAATLTLLPTCP